MGRQKLRLEIRRAVGGRGGFHGRNKDESKGIIGRSTSRSDEEDDDGHHNNNEHGGDGNTNDTSSAPFIGDIDSIVTGNGHNNNESIILLSKLSPVKTAAISNAVFAPDSSIPQTPSPARTAATAPLTPSPVRTAVAGVSNLSDSESPNTSPLSGYAASCSSAGAGSGNVNVDGGSRRPAVTREPSSSSAESVFDTSKIMMRFHRRSKLITSMVKDKIEENKQKAKQQQLLPRPATTKITISTAPITEEKGGGGDAVDRILVTEKERIPLNDLYLSSASSEDDPSNSNTNTNGNYIGILGGNTFNDENNDAEEEAEEEERIDDADDEDGSTLATFNTAENEFEFEFDDNTSIVQHAVDNEEDDHSSSEDFNLDQHLLDLGLISDDDDIFTIEEKLLREEEKTVRHEGSFLDKALFDLMNVDPNAFQKLRRSMSCRGDDKNTESNIDSKNEYGEDDDLRRDIILTAGAAVDDLYDLFLHHTKDRKSKRTSRRRRSNSSDTPRNHRHKDKMKRNSSRRKQESSSSDTKQEQEEENMRKDQDSISISSINITNSRTHNNSTRTVLASNSQMQSIKDITDDNDFHSDKGIMVTDTNTLTTKPDSVDSNSTPKTVGLIHSFSTEENGDKCDGGGNNKEALVTQLVENGCGGCGNVSYRVMDAICNLYSHTNTPKAAATTPAATETKVTTPVPVSTSMSISDNINSKSVPLSQSTTFDANNDDRNKTVSLSLAATATAVLDRENTTVIHLHDAASSSNPMKDTMIKTDSTEEEEKVTLPALVNYHDDENNDNIIGTAKTTLNDDISTSSIAVCLGNDDINTRDKTNLSPDSTTDNGSNNNNNNNKNATINTLLSPLAFRPPQRFVNVTKSLISRARVSYSSSLSAGMKGTNDTVNNSNQKADDDIAVVIKGNMSNSNSKKNVLGDTIFMPRCGGNTIMSCVSTDNKLHRAFCGAGGDDTGMEVHLNTDDNAFDDSSIIMEQKKTNNGGFETDRLVVSNVAPASASFPTKNVLIGNGDSNDCVEIDYDTGNIKNSDAALQAEAKTFANEVMYQRSSIKKVATRTFSKIFPKVLSFPATKKESFSTAEEKTSNSIVVSDFLFHPITHDHVVFDTTNCEVTNFEDGYETSFSQPNFSVVSNFDVGEIGELSLSLSPSTPTSLLYVDLIIDGSTCRSDDVNNSDMIELMKNDLVMDDDNRSISSSVVPNSDVDNIDQLPLSLSQSPSTQQSLLHVNFDDVNESNMMEISSSLICTKNLSIAAYELSDDDNFFEVTWNNLTDSVSPFTSPGAVVIADTEREYLEDNVNTIKTSYSKKGNVFINKRNGFITKGRTKIAAKLLSLSYKNKRKGDKLELNDNVSIQCRNENHNSTNESTYKEYKDSTAKANEIETIIRQSKQTPCSSEEKCEKNVYDKQTKKKKGRRTKFGQQIPILQTVNVPVLSKRHGRGRKKELKKKGTEVIPDKVFLTT